ncbi:NDR1/HIN1-like protein 6 [Andrographis paniculata]|uniref:NDR1/HIN1-like protein 6 n=1 Tax=Andrographis paniculata TaxID=175694 RepID=UPI0021E8D5EB|nr:NDR1/HIN1-like protein 6 [Andrographis paniculata]
MTDDRVYPSGKPNGAAAAAPVAVNPAKGQLYNPTRHPYRPSIPAAQNPRSKYKHKHRRAFSCRRCVCLTCFWSILVLLVILLLAAIAAAAFYALYRPHRPMFSVTSLKISSFNLTTTPADDSTHLTTKINITVSAKNPNKKFAFLYDPMSISVLSSNSVNLSSGSFSNFTDSPDSISIIHAATALNSQVLDADSLKSLQSDLKRRRGLPMEIVMDTMLGVKLEKHKMKKIGIRVKCGGIHGIVPKGKIVKPVVATTSDAKCKVDLRLKIFKWTF